MPFLGAFPHIRVIPVRTRAEIPPVVAGRLRWCLALLNILRLRVLRRCPVTRKVRIRRSVIRPAVIPARVERDTNGYANSEAAAIPAVMPAAIPAVVPAAVAAVAAVAATATAATTTATAATSSIAKVRCGCRREYHCQQNCLKRSHFNQTSNSFCAVRV